MSTLLEKRLKGQSHLVTPKATANARENDSLNHEHDPIEAIIAALRSYFLTHTFDPLTGEVHMFH